MEIETGKLRVLLIDECHLMWGDLSGYVWGKSDQEIAVPVVNERDKALAKNKLAQPSLSPFRRKRLNLWVEPKYI
ncbi:hypothetical protein B4U84_10180 [Westiellopsis prolifica IICB1]|nr:hypothetical protein B4U84_10180 [Westiellopsis prolifica IICB1]